VELYERKNLNLTKIIAIVNGLLERWGINETQKKALIGESSSSEIHMRLSVLLSIHEELRLIFENPQNIYGFMAMINHNPPFNGSRPLELACKNIEGLQQTYIAIRGISNGANEKLAPHIMRYV
jgi:hypothetical protein